MTNGPHQSPPQLPRLIRVYILCAALGFVLSAMFVRLLLWFDIASLGSLIARSDTPWIAILMLWVFHGALFSGLQFAYVIMSMAGPGENSER